MRALSVLLLLWLVASAETGVRAETPARPRARSVGRIEDPSDCALSGFFAALRAAEAGGGRAAIVQLGDSHTAADFFTGHLRHRLQDRFGDAGRGFLLPGRPVRHYYQRDARYGSEGTWTAEVGLRAEAAEPLGMAGVRARSASSDAVAWVSTCDTCKSGGRVSRFDIFYRRFPGGGPLGYRVDEGPEREVLTDGDSAPAFLSIPVPDGAHRLTLRPLLAPVELFGVALERDRPGVVVDALGIVGARAAHLFNWDFSVIATQLKRRDPRLVILAYGTNEADSHHLDLPQVGVQVEALVRRVRAAVPESSVLVLGPPDMQNRLRRDCPKGRRQPVPRECRYTTPLALQQIVAELQKASRRSGAAFFDVLAAMGGPGTMTRLLRQSPPLSSPDHVHLTQRGYEWLADLLLRDLLRRYDTRRPEGARACRGQS